MSGLFDEFSVHRQQLYRQVADQLQELIVAKSLEPGDKLPSERELAERMGVSRTVIREAIRALSVRGLLKVKPGSGTYVCDLSLQDAVAPIELFFKLREDPEFVEHLFEVRRMMEIEIVRLAAERATTDDMQTIAATLEKLATCDAGPQKLAKVDLAFHSALAAATHNTLFGLLLSPVSHLLQEVSAVSIYKPGARDVSVRRYKRIMRCLEEQDPEGAEHEMCKHLKEVRQLLEQVWDEL